MKIILKNIGRYIPRSKFVRGVGLLAGGTAFGQAIVVLCSPLLTRIYTPEQFGILAIFTSILSLLIVVSSLRYELAIPLPIDDETGANLLALSLVTVVLVSLFVGITCYFLINNLQSLPNAYSVLLPYLWLLPFGVLAAGGYNALSYWTTRKKEYSTLSYTKVLQSWGQIAVQIGAGLCHIGAVGLIFGFIVGRFLGVGTLWKKACLPQKSISYRAMLDALNTYKHFPLYNTASALINVVGIQAAPILITNYFSMDDTGYFSLTMRVLGFPAALIGQSVAQLYYPTAAELVNDKNATKEFTEKVATSLLVISFPIFAFIVLYGPELFYMIFGPSWTTSGRYAQILSPWILFSFISSPLSTFVLIKGKQKQTFLITIYESGLRIGSLCFGGILASLPLAISLYSGFGLLISLIYINWVLHLSGTNIIKCIIKLKMYLLTCISLLIMLFLTELVLTPRSALYVGAVIITLFAFWSYRDFYRKIADA